MWRRIAAALVVLGALAGAQPALAAGGNAAATQAYLQADLRLTRTAAGKIPAAKAAIDGVLAHVRHECPAAASESPQNPQSTQLSNEVIGAMVTAAIAVDPAAGRAFVRAVHPLRWSNASLTSAVRGYAAKIQTLLSLPQPNVCADVHSWAASGYRTLPANTLSFSPRFMAAWVAVGEQPAGLASFENPAARATARQAAQREEQISEFEVHEVETWGTIMNALELSP